MAERNPIQDLEYKILELKGKVNTNDAEVRGLLKAMQDDVEEIKAREKNYVRADSFALYERAFWIVATAVITLLIGGVWAAVQGYIGGKG